MYRKYLLAVLVLSALITGLSSPVIRGQSLELKPGYISGTVSVGQAINQMLVSASWTQYSSNEWFYTSAYSLTVNVPSGTSPVYAVRPQVYTDSNADYLALPSQSVAVSEGQISPADFIVNSAFINGTLTVQNGTLSTAYIYADNSGSGAPAWNAQTYTNLGRNSQFRFPVVPGAVRIRATVHFSNGTYVEVSPQQLGTLAENGETTFNINVTAPAADGTVQGAVTTSGPRTPSSRSVFVSGSGFSKSASVAANGSYQIGQVPSGSYNAYADVFYDQGRTYYRTPYGPQATGNPTFTIAGNTLVRDFPIEQSLIQGSLVLTGTRTLAHANYSEVYVNGQGGSSTQSGHGRDTVALPSGQFEFVVSPGTWYMNSSHYISFSSNVGGYLNGYVHITDYQNTGVPILIADLGPVERHLTYETGTVTVVLRSAGIPFSSPRVSISCSDVVNGQTRTFTSGSFSGNQVNVTEAPVTVVGIKGRCTMSAYGRPAGSGGETLFGQITADIVPGSDLTVDIGGPKLTVTAPAANSAFTQGPITVTGTATDDELVASITVNSVVASLTSTANPADPHEVAFTVSVPIVNGANQIVTIAKDNSGKSVSDVRNVYLDTQDPTVTWTPADGTVYPQPGSYVVSGNAKDNIGISTITVNGAVAYTNAGTPQTSVNFSRSVNLVGGPNQITVVVKDLGNRTITETRTVTAIAPETTTTVSTAPNPSVVGQSVQLSATVASNESGYPTPTGTVQFRVDGSLIATVGVSGGVATLNTTGLAFGSREISAVYSGNTIFKGSTGTGSHTVTKRGTITTLTSNINPATYGQTFAVTATVANVSSISGTPTGSVQFRLNGADIGGPVSLSGGVASRTFTGVGAGTPQIQAVYAGSPTHDGSTGTLTQAINKATPAVTWNNPAQIVYGTFLSSTQLNATANVAGTFAYTPAAGALLPAGTQTLSLTFTPADTNNYNVATRSVSLVVLKGNPAVTWPTPADIVYGTVLGSSQLNATSPVDGAFEYSPSAGTQLSAGTHTLSVTFTPADAANYNSAAKNVSLRVLKATPAISWNAPAPIEYGTLLSGTQLNATSATAGSFSYTPAAGTKLNAGAAQTLTASFTPADTNNYTVGSATVLIDVLKATPAITWPQPAEIVYGTLLGSQQLNAQSPVDGTFAYSPAAGTKLNAGSGQTLSVSFTPTDAANYNGVSATVTINVLRATPDITWNAPADIVYGTALSGTQLKATGSVPGTFTYSPAAGTTLNAGNGQTLSVSFTPADAQNYNAASASVTINVSKKTPTVTWNSPADIVFGTPLSGTQLNATGSVPGTFTYSPAAGTTLGANVHTLSVDFVPSDGANYNPVSGTTVLLNVLKATPSIAWNNPAPIVYGTALGGAQLNAATSVNGVFTYSPAPGAILGAGLGQVLTVSFTPTDQANYNGANASVAIDVAKAPSFTVVTGGTYLFDNQAHPAAGSVYGANGMGLGAPAIVYTPAPAPAVAPLAPGIYTVQATFAGDANHLPSAAAATITINAPPKIVSVTGPLSPQPVGTTATITAAFDDAATNDPHTCVFGWNDGASTQIVASSAGTSCSASHAFTTPGVYPVEVRVIDDEGYTAIEEFKYVVVFDPDGAFVTGGGWIVSPAGAYQADPSLTGKAHFGFVSKYRPGAAVPTGNTEFEFQVANFRFKSTAYDWLVVAGSRAQFQGTGTINGAGAYAFKLTGIDGQVTNGGGIDKFRIRIWDRVTGVVIYDNRLSEDETTGDPQEIGGGSIVIHTR